jgi:hypothetical protein
MLYGVYGSFFNLFVVCISNDGTNVENIDGGIKDGWSKEGEAVRDDAGDIEGVRDVFGSSGSDRI